MEPFLLYFYSVIKKKRSVWIYGCVGFNGVGILDLGYFVVSLMFYFVCGDILKQSYFDLQNYIDLRGFLNRHM